MKTTNLIIESIQELPTEQLKDLIQESVQEGFTFVTKLVNEWNSGVNRFDKVDEHLYQVSYKGKIVGIGGVNNNPYKEEGKVGRIRHVYVRPAYRSKGIGKILVLALMDSCKDKYDKITLRTMTQRAAKFYESLGFQKVTNATFNTHEYI